MHIPALSFVAVVDGRLAYARAFGQRDLATQAPNTLDTLFPIGSATKSFTAYATCVLQDANYLRLDDRPQNFLPYLQLRDNEANTQLTFRDMLCHRVGLMSKNDLATVDDNLTREEYIRIAGGAHPTARFRERFQYSNVMFTAAGEAIARAHNTSWEELITQRILTPLGMRESAANLHAVPANLTQTTSYVYNPSAQDWIVTPPTLSLNPMAPAGSISLLGQRHREMADHASQQRRRAPRALHLGERLPRNDHAANLCVGRHPLRARLGHVRLERPQASSNTMAAARASPPLSVSFPNAAAASRSCPTLRRTRSRQSATQPS